MQTDEELSTQFPLQLATSRCNAPQVLHQTGSESTKMATKFFLQIAFLQRRCVEFNLSLPMKPFQRASRPTNTMNHHFADFCLKRANILLQPDSNAFKGRQPCTFSIAVKSVQTIHYSELKINSFFLLVIQLEGSFIYL